MKCYYLSTDITNHPIIYTHFKIFSEESDVKGIENPVEQAVEGSRFLFHGVPNSKKLFPVLLSAY